MEHEKLHTLLHGPGGSCGVTVLQYSSPAFVLQNFAGANIRLLHKLQHLGEMGQSMNWVWNGAKLLFTPTDCGYTHILGLKGVLSTHLHTF